MKYGFFLITCVIKNILKSFGFQETLEASECSEYTITVLAKWLMMAHSDLKDIPLGTLLRARRAFVKADSASDSDTSGSNSDSEAERMVKEVKGKESEKVEWSIKPRKDIPKRANKNA